MYEGQVGVNEVKVVWTCEKKMEESYLENGRRKWKEQDQVEEDREQKRRMKLRGV